MKHLSAGLDDPWGEITFGHQQRNRPVPWRWLAFYWTVRRILAWKAVRS